MELDELKAGWNVFSDRLRQQEILNKRIIREMIRNRTHSAYASQIRYEWIGLAILLVIMAAVVPFMWTQSPKLTTGSFIWLESVFMISLVVQFYSISLLVIIALIGFFILQKGILIQNVWRWVLFISSLLLTIPIYIFICRRNFQRISTIEQGLEELKEFEEE